MNKIKVYLDSGDYLRLYSAKNESDRQLAEFIGNMVDSGKIIVCLSLPVMMEVIQASNEKYKEDRMARAKFIKRICGNNALRCFFNMNDGEPVYNDSLKWNPNFAYEKLDIEKMKELLIEKIKQDSSVHRNIRNKIHLPNTFKRYIIKNWPGNDYIGMDYYLSKRFRKENILYRFLVGEISREKANEYLWDTIDDPELFFLNYYYTAGKKNYFTGPFRNMSDIIKNFCLELVEIFKNNKSEECIALNFDCSKYENVLHKYIPPDIDNIINAFVRENYKSPHFQDSDVADMMHALYLPYVDLWRGDKHFSTVLMKHQVPHNEKIVPKLAELPKRITELLNKEE